MCKKSWVETLPLSEESIKILKDAGLTSFEDLGNTSYIKGCHLLGDIQEGAILSRAWFKESRTRNGQPIKLNMSNWCEICKKEPYTLRYVRTARGTKWEDNQLVVTYICQGCADKIKSGEIENG